MTEQERHDASVVASEKPVAFVTRREFRRFAIALLVFACIVAFGGTWIVNLEEKVSALQKSGHASRVAAQAVTNAEIRQLACLLISQVPDNPKVPEIAEYRTFYGCPQYSKTTDPFSTITTPTLVPSKSPSSGSSGSGGSPSSTARAAPARTSHGHKPSPTPSTVSRGHSPPARSKPTPSVTPAPPLQFTEGQLCLLGICIPVPISE